MRPSTRSNDARKVPSFMSRVPVFVGTFSCRGKVSMKALEVLMQSPEHEAWADMAASAATHPDESDLADARSFARWVRTLASQGHYRGL